MSQWAVNDESTALMMTKFYSDLKTGTPKGTALRAAALERLQDPKYAHSYFWAPFVLMGDWR